ncbi:hypothetical protein DV515_00013495 [Chloebia gouldiae]|uniref:Uncharacterized protein n=1 Tax=Chloebia gouldiae TaxID=44316 RepID=A0A3L8S1A6_CHLGU|nr:hypothetical protein DV515_00013495 [Chloebia gouldiae]
MLDGACGCQAQPAAAGTLRDTAGHRARPAGEEMIVAERVTNTPLLRSLRSSETFLEEQI